MNPEEDKQRYTAIMKMIEDEIKSRGISSYLMNNPRTYSHSNAYGFRTSVNGGMSPTDIDARGRFSYQEPEVDEQGTYYGYKVLRKHCSNPGCDEFVSPRYHAKWVEGHLRADRTPTETSMHGIHFTKRPDHPELDNYYSPFAGAGFRDERSVLVKCALYGETLIMTEQGFRAEEAQIIGVFENGYWTSYQDYKERSHADSRRTAYPWQDREEIKWEVRWDYGRWQDPDTFTNPLADS